MSTPAIEPGRRQFILANTVLARPFFTPEIALHMAAEMTPLWHLTEDELDQTGLEPPFWAFAWAGGLALSRYVLDRPHWVAGRSVLDFASGSGIVALAAMRAGASSALAADIDPFCADAIALNAEANGVEVAFTCEDLLSSAPPEVDVVLAGDVFYDPRFAARALPWLEAANAAGARVLIGDPGRAYFPRDGLRILAEYEVATTRELEDSDFKRTRVWTFVGNGLETT